MHVVVVVVDDDDDDDDLGFSLLFYFGLVWFLYLMAYQLSRVIQCQSHSCRRILAV